MSQSLPIDQMEPWPAGAAVPLGQLPAPLDALIGRERELATIRQLLAQKDTRLVTLVGPGGVGKTRLALATGAGAAPDEGVVFVPLAPVGEPALVAAAIAERLDISESGGRPLRDELAVRLRDERMLLILDNFEHLLAAAPIVSDLLHACPGLQVLATSRHRLGLSGEHELAIPPLAVIDPRQPVSIEDLARVPAIALFVVRAQAAAPSFALTEKNGPLVAEICQHLDGLPLAIELAAPRMRMLSPSALLSRLTNRLRILTDGPRDAPERLQTMRQAIAWSYDLLDPAAQALFRRLAVFSGGFTLEAAEHVGGGGLAALGGDACGLGGGGAAHLRGEEDEGHSDTPSVLDLVSALVDESLLQRAEQPDGEWRFGMLETVREYARSRLDVVDEERAARQRHAEYCLFLAEQADSGQNMPQDRLDQLQVEHDNLRGALTWSIEHDPELALRLASGLWRFWSQRGYWREGRGWLDRALAAAPDAPPAVRAEALAGAGSLADEQGDFVHARRSFAESLALGQQIGDERRVGRALRSLGIVASNQNELDLAAELFHDALDRLRAVQDEAAIGRCLNDLGLVAERRGEPERAIAFYQEALRIARATADQTFAALLLSNLGGAHTNAGDLARGTALTAEALDLSRMIGDRYGEAINLFNLADCVQRRGDIPGAWRCYRESLDITDELGERKLVTRVLDHIAHLLTLSERPRAATHLLAAAAHVRQEIGDDLFPIEEAFVVELIADTRAAIDDASFAAAWELGEGLSLAQAIDLAQSLELPVAGPGKAAVVDTCGLTAREIEVLRLVAAGRSDKEIAALLAISNHTASKHVGAIRRKLDAPSRTGAVTAAREAGLLL